MDDDDDNAVLFADFISLLFFKSHPSLGTSLLMVNGSGQIYMKDYALRYIE